MSAEIWRQAELIAELIVAVGDLAEDTPCRLDHHGFCQEHGWLDSRECPHPRAVRALRELKAMIP